MSEQVRYITNEQGERVGVLLDLEAYNRLANPLALNEEFAKVEGTRAAIAPYFVKLQYHQILAQNAAP